MRSHVIVFAWLQMVLAVLLTVSAIVAGSFFLTFGNLITRNLEAGSEEPQPPAVHQSAQRAKPAALPKPSASGNNTHNRLEPPTGSHPAQPTKPDALPADSGADATIVYNVPLLTLNTGGLLIFVSLLLCALSIAAGVGLLRFAPWARGLGITVAVLDILAIIPIPLALGVYGLIILLNRETAELFQHPARPEPGT